MARLGIVPAHLAATIPGRLIHTSVNGRASVYVRDFGGGNKVFTHVYWAR